MKVVKFFAIALVGSFLVASNMFANDADKSADVKAAENSVREQLASALSNVSIENPDYVYVQFSVSGKGLEVINVKGENQTLIHDVKAALASQVIANPVLNGNYVIKVTFVNR